MMRPGVGPRRVGPRSGRIRGLALTLVVLMGAAACAPVGGSGSPTASPQEQFCDLFNEVTETPPVENAVLVKDDVVAVADDVSDVDVVGSDCESPTAKVK